MTDAVHTQVWGPEVRSRNRRANVKCRGATLVPEARGRIRPAPPSPGGGLQAGSSGWPGCSRLCRSPHGPWPPWYKDPCAARRAQPVAPRTPVFGSLPRSGLGLGQPFRDWRGATHTRPPPASCSRFPRPLSLSPPCLGVCVRGLTSGGVLPRRRTSPLPSTHDPLPPSHGAPPITLPRSDSVL